MGALDLLILARLTASLEISWVGIKDFGARAGIIHVSNPENLCLGCQPGVIQPDLVENNEAFNSKHLIKKKTLSVLERTEFPLLPLPPALLADELS